MKWNWHTWTGRLIAAFAVVVLSIPLQAQDSDPEALALLRNLRSTYSEFENMVMDFELTIKDLENDLEEVKSGELSLEGDKFRLAFDEQLLICDNVTLWTVFEDVDEVQINDFEPEDEEFMSPSELFKLPESDYFAVLGEHLVEEGKKLQVLELTPLDKELSFHKIKVFADVEVHRILRAVILDKNGIHYTYAIDNFRHDLALDYRTFHFEEEDYPNAEIIDLRE